MWQSQTKERWQDTFAKATDLKCGTFHYIDRKDKAMKERQKAIEQANEIMKYPELNHSKDVQWARQVLKVNYNSY